MLSPLRFALVAGCVAVLPAVAAAIDQVPWAPTLGEAQKAAADQGKLVLVHFYNDHCPPCERVAREVFADPSVGQAVSRNYVAVKVHAGAQPKVAEQFRVDRWPTDIICTPAGLEIMRTTSPQRSDAYVNLINQVALQGGVGATRQWQASMQAAGEQVLDPHVAQAQAVTGEAVQAAQGYANQTATAVQGYSNQAATTAQGYGNRATTTFMDYAAQANRWNQQAISTAQQTGTAAQQLGANVQQTGQDLRTAWNAGASGAVAQPNPTANSAYAQFAQSPTGAAPAPGAQTATPTAAPATPQMSVAPAMPSLPTANPFVSQPTGTTPPAAASSPVAAAPAAAAPPIASPMSTSPTQAAPPSPTTEVPAGPSTSAPPASAATSTASDLGQVHAPLLAASPAASTPPRRALTPASEAPPIALEGYCPVTLVEQNKWQRANPQFGVIHIDRTYLFVSEAEQRRFLADPDAYSPVLSGFDPVVFAQRGELVEGKRCYGVKYQNQIFLFADKDAREVFIRSPMPFANEARQAMHRASSGVQLR